MSVFDLSNVRYVKRILVGSKNPEAVQSDEAIEAAAALLNRCLTEVPSGRIIGIEKNFNILNIGEHQVVLQSICYHVGFPRKPLWLDET